MFLIRGLGDTLRKARKTRGSRETGRAKAWIALKLKTRLGGNTEECGDELAAKAKRAKDGEEETARESDECTRMKREHGGRRRIWSAPQTNGIL